MHDKYNYFLLLNCHPENGKADFLGNAKFFSVCALIYKKEISNSNSRIRILIREQSISLSDMRE